MSLSFVPKLAMHIELPPCSRPENSRHGTFFASARAAPASRVF
jgi:hypothetical protein